jgi:FkbM family methyltransferase
MRERRTLYIVILAMLVGFILGFLYTSSYSKFMMTNNKAAPVSQNVVVNRQSFEQNVKVQVHTKQITEPQIENQKLLVRSDFWGTVISRNDSGWYKMERFCDPMAKFVRTQLRGPQQTPIHVYTAQEDQWVSGNIIRQGMWEGHLVTRIHNLLINEPDVVFVDIGANVGVFSLTVAKLGRHVISVDALDGNVARLCRSMQDGKLGDHMTIIHNALSYQREKVSLGTHKRNVGGTYVKKLDKLGFNKNGQQALVVDAILLDDLLEIFNIKRAVIKMDVETFEANVLKGGGKFFTNVKVEYLLLEFVSHRGKASGDFIVDFLKNHSLISEIPNKNHATWSGEVMFKRVP